MLKNVSYNNDNHRLFVLLYETLPLAVWNAKKATSYKNCISDKGPISLTCETV